MKAQNTKYNKHRGAALILVVVVTVLLAVIGTMFLMTSRVSEMETVAVTDQRDLKAAVQTVVARIDEVLVKDLFGNDGQMVNADLVNIDTDEPSDYPTHNTALNPVSGLPFNPGADGINWTPDDVAIPGYLDDFWLASLEPVWLDAGPDGSTGTQDDTYAWPHITDLWGTLQVDIDSLFTQSYDNIYWLDPDDETDQTQWANGAAIWDAYKVSANNVVAKVISPKDRMKAILQGSPANVTAWDDPANTSEFGARADADGDGVADSRWVKIPGLTTSRGKDVFVAVRIIDNCAMLNLNAAHCFYQGSYATATTPAVSPFVTSWYATNADMTAGTPYHDNQTGTGRYLTEINYMPFLRGRDLNGNSWDGTASGDDWYNLMVAKGFNTWLAGVPVPFTTMQCQNVLMNIEDPGSAYHFFDIGDELELRNRYLMTSNVESRFEQDAVANYTLDSGGGIYSALRIPRDNSGNYPISDWKSRVDPANFDNWSGWLNPAITPIPYKYDRRHVCTFYSFDRNLRKGQYPLLISELTALGLTPQQIEAVKPVFMPLGAVTTNIENPDALQPYNNIETRKRILHLLYALREYYYQENGGNLNTAALSAAQVVSNIIDYSDGTGSNGPFADPFYNSQLDEDCTFITEQIIEDMIAEVSGGFLPVGSIIFGLNQTVFGYERQPFISEIYASWTENNPAPDESDDTLNAFAVEVVNPYPDILDMEGWVIRVGAGATAIDFTFDNSALWDVPEINSGRAVYHYNLPMGSVSGIYTNSIPMFANLQTLYFDPTQDISICLLRPDPQTAGQYLCVDVVPSVQVRSVLNLDGEYSLQRDDDNWKFIYNEFGPAISVDTGAGYQLGTDNGQTTATADFFQLAVPDDQYPLARWHELEVLSVYGNEPESSDPNVTDEAITVKIANQTPKHFDLAGTSSDLLDYLCTINRPDKGTLPGRININTAPVHVIAAAIPPALADPNVLTAAPPGYSSLDLAQDIVNKRPYSNLGELLTKVPMMEQYIDGTTWADPDADNVGMQSIEDDIEERDWVLSNLANKFTVRSDVFTAYILVRLGENGPQRRMIAIFDRSGVWTPTDRPKLVALHPVPDPR